MHVGHATTSLVRYVATAALAQAATPTRPMLGPPAEFLSRFVGATAVLDDTRRVLRTVVGLFNQVAVAGGVAGDLEVIDSGGASDFALTADVEIAG